VGARSCRPRWAPLQSSSSNRGFNLSLISVCHLWPSARASTCEKAFFVLVIDATIVPPHQLSASARLGASSINRVSGWSCPSRPRLRPFIWVRDPGARHVRRLQLDTSLWPDSTPPTRMRSNVCQRGRQHLVEIASATVSERVAEGLAARLCCRHPPLSPPLSPSRLPDVLI